MLWLLVLLAVLFLVGHYGLPEQVNPRDFQEPPPAIKIMRGAEPFRLQGKTAVGFLLVHGFEDSPYTMRNIGDLLHREGHTVIAPLLPGHVRMSKISLKPATSIGCTRCAKPMYANGRVSPIFSSSVFRWAETYV